MKTAREAGYDEGRAPRARVIVVCGPPGAGKSQYVRERAQRGDLIVDVDALYQALSGLPMYDKPEGLLPFVCEARDAVIARLKRPSAVRAAWIVTSAADAETRNRLRCELGAQVVVLEVTVEECMRRIAADQRRRQSPHAWQPLVEAWWREYQPLDGDLRVPGGS